MLGKARAPAAAFRPFQPGWTAWASGYGAYDRNGGQAPGTGTLISRLYGSLIGLDYHFSPTALAGFSLGGSGLNWSQSSTGGNGSSFQFGVYGTKYWGRYYVSGLLDFTNTWFNSSGISGGDTLVAKFNAQSYGGRLEAGYRYPLRGLSTVSPYAAMQLHYFHVPAYMETDLSGGTMGVNYNASDVTYTRSELGARFETFQALATMPLRLRAGLAWAHDWLSNSSVTAAFAVAPAAPTVLAGASQPSNWALTNVEAELGLTPH